MLADRALAQADEVDARLASGEDLPLAGVPLAVKDHVWLAGAPATNGSRALADFVPQTRLRRGHSAGRSRSGRRRQDEQPGVLLPGRHRLTLVGSYPQPLGPRPDSPGGSSGGSGVAVATGMAALADRH